MRLLDIIPGQWIIYLQWLPLLSKDSGRLQLIVGDRVLFNLHSIIAHLDSSRVHIQRICIGAFFYIVS